MDKDHIELLKEAAALIRQGNTKSARQIIISVLREDQDNFQAWYMLSFAVPVEDKQIEAVQRALLISPDNPKALERLKKLGGEPLPPNTEIPREAPPEKKVEPFILEKAAPPPQPVVPDDELLASRLFGATDEEPQESEPEVEEALLSEPEQELTPEETLQALKQAVNQEPVTEQEIDFGEVVDEPPLRIKRRRSSGPAKKVLGINRNYLILSILMLIFLLLAALGLSPQFRQAVLPIVGPAATETNVAQAALTEAASPSPTLTPTQPLPSPTPRPTATQPTDLFDLSSFASPSAELQVQFEEIQQAVADLTGAQTQPETKSYAITDPQLQTLIWDFAEVSGFSQQVELTHSVYQLLNLASSTDDFSSFYQNYWVDPNGTLALLNENAVAVIGFEFSDYQKFSYAQAVAQILRRSQPGLDRLYLQDLPCVSPSEACDIWNALVKGDAVIAARQWADQTLDESTQSEIAESNLKYFYTPIVPAPTGLMEALRTMPYTTGADFVQAVYQAGGWPAVNDAFVNPPTTTEQLLHPEKYLSGEIPADLTGPDLSAVLSEEWVPVYQSSLGEWKTYLILAYQINPSLRVEVETAQEAAEGWNGDQTWLFARSGSSPVAAHQWLWDSQTDQQQFEEVLVNLAASRIGGVETEILGQACISSTDQVSCILSRTQETIWILSPDTETTELVLGAYLAAPEE